MSAVRSSWPEVPLGEVCEFIYGKSLPESARAGGDVPVFGSNGQVGNHDEALTDGPTIVIGRKGSFGEVNFSPSPCWPIDTTYFVDGTATKANLRWLAYRLAALGLNKLNKAAAVPGLNREDAYRQRLLLPPLPEQRRIAEILDKADALRAKRRAALAQLDTLTQSIFLDMFGDPATNPKGWPVRRLDSVCALVNGRAFKPEEWEESGLPIIRIQNLNDPTKPFNYTTQSLPERFRVRRADVLFSWSGTPGTSFGCFRWNGPEGWLNQHIFNVRLNDALDGEFFIAHVNLKLTELIAKAHGGVGLQHVTKGMVDETILMIPPTHLQADFARNVTRMEKVRTDQAASLAEFDALFASLQHRAFRGEL